MKNFVQLFSLLFFCVISPAHASPIITLDMRLTVDDGKQATPKLQTEPGKAALISEIQADGTGYEIEAVPSFVGKENKSESISIRLKVYSIKNGKKSLISSPRVVTREGMAAEISDVGAHKLQLSVNPTLTRL